MAFLMEIIQSPGAAGEEQPLRCQHICAYQRGPLAWWPLLTLPNPHPSPKSECEARNLNTLAKPFLPPPMAPVSRLPSPSSLR